MELIIVWRRGAVQKTLIFAGSVGRDASRGLFRRWYGRSLHFIRWAFCRFQFSVAMDAHLAESTDHPSWSMVYAVLSVMVSVY